MLINETVAVVRELHVAPCLACGETNIELSDSGYSSFNIGGGRCTACGHKTTGTVGCLPTMEQLAAVWNAGNDIPHLLAVEEGMIANAAARMAELRMKAAGLRQLDADDIDNLMPADEFLQAVEAGGFIPDDGVGYWATETARSAIDAFEPQPAWATHVLWFNN